MLDLTFDLVLGTPWLMVVNPHMDWTRGTMMVQVKGWWISLPLLAHRKLCSAMACVCKVTGCGNKTDLSGRGI